MPADTPVRDVAIVGAGLAGLVAAYDLSDLDIVVLEADRRPGGRILSRPDPPYWLNFGAHMFGEPGTVVGDLVAELGLDARPIAGRLLGIAMGSTRLLAAPPETYPFLLPLPAAARLSMIRMGLALRRGAAEIVAAMAPRPGETPWNRRARLLALHGERTLAEYVGRLHPAAAVILETITERNGAAPAAMSAGHALRSFTNVWSRHAPGRNLIGGSSRLPEAIAAMLGERLRCNATVEQVESSGPHVDIVWRDAAGDGHRLRARRAIVATPAFVASRVVRNLPGASRVALDDIRYGAYLTAAMRTREARPMPWDGNYAVATPGRSFSVVFNQATTLRAAETRQEGGSVMLFRGARGAADLMNLSDSDIAALFRADFMATFPEARGRVGEIVIKRWPHGAPYAFPGRDALQPALTRPIDRVELAGDYLEFPNMEAAASTGREAAQRTRAALAAEAGFA